MPEQPPPPAPQPTAADVRTWDETEGNMPLTAHMYPTPTEPVGWCVVFEVVDHNGDVLIDDAEVPEHPEVPLTIEQRDAVLARMGYSRLGAWTDGEDGTATAPVQPTEWEAARLARATSTARRPHHRRRDPRGAREDRS